MLLREMTNSALAHSFKRFAQLAVAGLALAGLAACGGGGSSTPTPPTPTPTPPAEMKVEPPEDGGVSPDTLDDLNECVTNIEPGTPTESRSCGFRYLYTQTNQCDVTINVTLESESAANGWAIEAISDFPPGERQQLELLCVSHDVQRFRFCAQRDDVDSEHEDWLRCVVDNPPWQIVESFTPPTPPPGRTPTPSGGVFTFTATDACNDGRPVEFRIFEQVGSVTPRSRRYPGGNQVLVTRGLNQPGTSRIACQAGTNLCWGGRIRGRSDLGYYGVDLDGSKGCSDCCTPCGGTRNATFTCY